MNKLISRLQTCRYKLAIFFKSITFRLLVFNLLLAIFPVGAFLFLGTYEKQLLDSQERAMVQQGRILAASLPGDNLAVEAREALARLGNRNDARLRILDTMGRLLADSALISQLDGNISGQQEIPNGIQVGYATNTSDYIADETSYPEESIIYRIGAMFPRIFRRITGYFRPPKQPGEEAEYYIGKTFLDGPEVLAALEDGRYGAATRISQGQVSVTLYSAIPIVRNEKVIGAVLVSRSTFAILNNLYQIRVDIMTIFLLGVCGAVVLSILLARAITFPVGRLRKQAERLLDERGKMLTHFKPLRGSNEVAALSLALHKLSTRLQERTQLLEEFIADLAHEMKNPVAGILSATELAGQIPENNLSSDTGRFLDTISREGHRIEHLLSDLRELISLDVHLEKNGDESVDVRKLSETLINPWAQRQKKNINAVWTCPVEDSILVKADQDRIAQAILNLLDNAASFSPIGGKITLKVSAEEDKVLVSVTDQGPGVPETEQIKIFKRWYTDRPPNEASLHTGLGLAIVQGIAAGYGGSVSVLNLPEGGAQFTLEFPRCNE